ncbi:MAG: hypothetical protein KDI71_02540 [Xanthomonadales bacterium]|nr:hypothetical protein [Xanthomonadales bacterium]
MSSAGESAAVSSVPVSVLRMASGNTVQVLVAFGLLAVSFRLLGAGYSLLVGPTIMVWAQLLSAMLYLWLTLGPCRRGHANLFLGVLGPEFVLWGSAMVLTYGLGSCFHLHALFVTAGILLLLHELPARRRLVLFVMPIALPIPLLLLLRLSEPAIQLDAQHEQLVAVFNQGVGAAYFMIICGLATLDHARARQLAESRAETQTRLIEDLSHELRTPIATVLTSAQGAQLGGQASAEVGECLQWIEESARAAGRLTQRMLDLATLDRGWRPDSKPVALAEGVAEIVERIRPLAGAHGACLRAELDPAPQRQVDLASLEIVLQNLIGNALAHSPRGSVVTVQLRMDGNGLPRIAVADQGEGIAAEDLPRVFDRLWRADRARTRDQGRFGLGLSIAQRHAHLMDARIEVQSKLGKGSIFTVIFVV